MTRFLVAESLKNSTSIREHKVLVSSQIFDHNFLTTYPRNIWFAPWCSVQFSLQNEIKYGIHNKYFNFHLNTLQY